MTLADILLALACLGVVSLTAIGIYREWRELDVKEKRWIEERRKMGPGWRAESTRAVLPEDESVT